jgi:geranylgeranyl pyrophosphate synthase
MNDAAKAHNGAFSQRMADYQQRVEDCLDSNLPASEQQPERLNQAMRYALLGGGKRIRPLLAYATGEMLGLPAEVIDIPAIAVEMIHGYSLIHDDLPAMDDDDLRRGKPTTHIAYDEATAIIAGDALQALAFELIAEHPTLAISAEARLRISGELARASGPRGMAGGQAIDMASEGQRIDGKTLTRMFEWKTGALIRAAVLMAAACREDLDAADVERLADFAEAIGLAFQIRDDLLDIEGESEKIGKPQGSDIARDKATWPALFGVETARKRVAELQALADKSLAPWGENAEGLRYLARLIVERDH